MSPNEVELLSRESERLTALGIPFKHIRISDGRPVVIVPPEVMNVIICERDGGKKIPGLFISENGCKWTASRLIHGKHEHRSGLTECLAYRWTLGYPIGETERRSRYAGQTPYRNSRKKTKKH